MNRPISSRTWMRDYASLFSMPKIKRLKKKRKRLCTPELHNTFHSNCAKIEWKWLKEASPSQGKARFLPHKLWVLLTYGCIPHQLFVSKPIVPVWQKYVSDKISPRKNVGHLIVLDIWHFFQEVLEKSKPPVFSSQQDGGISQYLHAFKCNCGSLVFCCL